MPKHNVSVKVTQGQYRTVEVPQEVYSYIKQLENAVRFEHSKKALAREYPERFKDYV